MTYTTEDLKRLLEENSDKSPQAGLEHPLLDEYGIPPQDLANAVTADVVDTYAVLIPQLIEEHGEEFALSPVSMGAVLAAHSQLWFLLGLRIGKDHHS